MLKVGNPVCGDIYAKTFMNEDGLRVFEAFQDETSPNASGVSRHRIIDDFLRQELLANPDLSIVIIGAGFDSRAFRLKGGRWIELDEPQVITYKNERLPATDCQNELHRIPINFSTDSIEEKLLPFSNNSRTVVIIEGVFLYLDEKTIRELLEKLHRLFPQHKLICDLMTKKFFEKYSKTLHEKIADIGTAFKFTVGKPEKTFLESGYQLKEKVSMIEKAVDFGLLPIPKILLKTTFHTLANGYAVYVFSDSKPN